MTPEILRSVWSKTPKVPFWNYDFKKMAFGLELEYFIGQKSKRGVKLATKSDFEAAIHYLNKHHNFIDHKIQDQPGRVSKDTRLGFITIKPDFAWHILEIALPPRFAISEVKSLLIECTTMIDCALKEAGLFRLNLNCLPSIPDSMEFVQLERLQSHLDILSKRKKGNENIIPEFPALITSTQVHLNIFNEEAFNLLPFLYQQELKLFKKFNKPQIFDGKTHEDIRDYFYRNALGEDYALCTIPKTIPKDIDQYCQMMNRSPKLFPNDPLFGVRDLSYIRPTKYGTLEFRSTPSFNNINTVIEIVKTRITQVKDALNTKLSFESKQRSSYELSRP
jgi:hypothetical protein